MKYLTIILSFISVLLAFKGNAQSDTLFVRYDLREADSIHYTIDTLIRKTPFGPHYLFETAWLPNTPNQLETRGYGLFPLSVESNCTRDRVEGETNKLLSIERSDSTLTVKYRVVANCCYSFLCNMEVVDSTVVNLIYYEYGDLCGCTCSHELEYRMKIDFLDEESEMNFKKLEYITLNNELKLKLN